MVFNGFCDKQNKNYSIEASLINTGALDDLTPNYTIGRIKCNYASKTGCCSNPKQCSILKASK